MQQKITLQRRDAEVQRDHFSASPRLCVKKSVDLMEHRHGRVIDGLGILAQIFLRFGVIHQGGIGQ